MTQPNPTGSEEKIVNVAERMIRARGYNGFSFREIADEIGVKSSSVHYHFATKGALGAEVARRYTRTFLNSLGPADAQSETADNIVENVRLLTRDSLFKERLMCLCGMLGAEVDGLPPEVAQEAGAFFRDVTGWMVVALSRSREGIGRAEIELETFALNVLASLEGALIIARSLKDNAIFDRITMPSLPASTGATAAHQGRR